MPTFIKPQSWKHYALKSSMILEIMTYILCLFSLLTAFVDNTSSIKIYNITVIFGLLSLILRGKQQNYNLTNFTLPFSIFVVGLLDLIWYSAFKIDNSPFRATYHNYLNTAKIFLFGSFIVFLVLSSKLKLKKELVLYILYSISFIIAAYAFYISRTHGYNRISFGIGTATGAAYSTMLIGIVSGVSILYTKKNHPFLFLLNSSAIFYVLVLTQTRATLLLFPVICFITLITYYNKSHRKFGSAIFILVTILISIVVIFNKPIQNRYNEALNDLNHYANDNSISSLGARLAMYEVGLDIFKESPFLFRSAESRAESMNLLVSKQNRLRGALEFSNVHLHNEIIEAASLKGILGVLSTLFVYFSLFYTSYKKRALGLFILTLGIVGVGISDVIIWARSIPIIVISATIILLLINNRNIIPNQE
ncbi:O-antigen ligase family protein [Escherichia albertii]|nr:O-antigen ligase family protein [Escherichia albertii]EJI9011236.1 O-antigen ligase family protein [Escherichia albertii]EJQ6147629.1 O-antigen ligase family protein [Escherichia albertii]HBM9791813.1 O-antigen ligase family protein [Escherichia albertii]